MLGKCKRNFIQNQCVSFESLIVGVKSGQMRLKKRVLFSFYKKIRGPATFECGSQLIFDIKDPFKVQKYSINTFSKMLELKLFLIIKTLKSYSMQELNSLLLSWTFVNNFFFHFYFYFYLCSKHKRLNYRRLSTLDYHSKQNLGNIQKLKKLFVCWEVEKKRQQQQKQPAAPKCIKV